MAVQILDIGTQYSQFVVNSFIIYDNNNTVGILNDDIFEYTFAVDDSISGQVYYLKDSSGQTFSKIIDYTEIMGNFEAFTSWSLVMSPNYTNYTLDYALINSVTNEIIQLQSVGSGPGVINNYQPFTIHSVYTQGQFSDYIFLSSELSNNQYNQLQVEYTQLLQNFGSLQQNYNTLQQEYEKLTNKVVLSDTFDVIADGVGVVKDVLNIQIAPNISIGMVATIPIVVSVLLFMLKALIK